MNKSGLQTHKILLVDDDKSFLDIYSYKLKSKGINNIICCDDSRLVMDKIARNKINVVLLDLTMPNLSGEELLILIKRDYPDIPVIIITGSDDVSTAVECIQLGAFDYLVKPIESNRFIGCVQKAIEIRELKNENTKLKKAFFNNELENPEAFSSIITRSEKMRSIFLYIESVAQTDRPVLITGETGVGKEMIAGVIHPLSGGKGEYITVNVAGLDNDMFTDTLFGHSKGAFTGAMETRKGLVKKASKGTLFLDEIGDLSIASQIKLLRLLETGEYYSIGSDMPMKSEARIILATNRNLDELVDSNLFRKDLYYRISTHKIEIPPLRDRMEDIPLLVDFFLETECGETVPNPELYNILSNYNFPGNIRELKSIILDIASRDKKGTFSSGSIKTIIDRKCRPNCKKPEESTISFPGEFPTLKEASEILIEEALKRSDNHARAAKLLGISPAALCKRLLRAKDK